MMPYPDPEEWFTPPVVRLCVNQSWAPWLLGLINQGADPSYWPIYYTDHPGQADNLSDGMLQYANVLAGGVLSECAPDLTCTAEDLLPYGDPGWTRLYNFSTTENPRGAWERNRGGWQSGVGVYGTVYQDSPGHYLRELEMTWRTQVPGVLVNKVLMIYTWGAELIPDNPVGNYGHLYFRYPDQSSPFLTRYWWEALHTNDFSNMNVALTTAMPVSQSNLGHFLLRAGGASQPELLGGTYCQLYAVQIDGYGDAPE